MTPNSGHMDRSQSEAKPHGIPEHSDRRHKFCRVATVAAALTLLSSLSITVAAEFALPEGPNRGLIYARCRTCHDLQYVVESKGLTPDAWDGLLDDMEGFGVELTPAERKKILTYLSTYMSSNPPPAPVSVSLSQPGDTKVSGKAVFLENCSACHQDNAKGIEGNFPPLAGNADLFLARDFPAKVVLNGMTGTIKVSGAPYEGEMPSFAHLPDNKIAAVINYLRKNFGNAKFDKNTMEALTPADVRTARARPATPAEVLAYRASLK